MTKISKKSAYPVKIPVRKDYFVGTDSDNNGKTVNFDFESTAKLINELNGTPILNYIFKTDNNIPLAVLTEGVFLSEGNETTIANISKLYINKKNFHEENMSDLFRFIAVNREVFVMKLRNSSNLADSVYFKITDATEFQDHFILDVAIELSNTAVPELVNFNVYFFDFELASSGEAIDLSGYATKAYVDEKDVLLENRITDLENADSGVGLPIEITDVTGLTDELTDRYTKSEVNEIDTALNDRITELEGSKVLYNRFTGKSYVIWSGTGLTYDVVYTSYYLENILYPGGTVQKTLATSDPTNPRFDLIKVNNTGVIVATGTPSASPEVPSADPNTELAISSVLVEAGSTVPSNVSIEDVYKENSEWTAVSNNGTVNFNATTIPFQGTKHIDCGSFSNGQYLRFTDTVLNQVTDFSLLKFYVNLKATFANTAKFSIKFYNGSTLISSIVTVASGNYNFERTIVNTYQTVIVPLSDFTFSSSSFDRIEIVMIGANASGFRMDNISLAQGVGSSSTEQNAITSIITDSGIANANTKDDTFQFKGANGLIVSAIGKIITFTSNFTTALKNNYDSAYTWVTTNGSNVMTHLSRTDNPHNVTKSQVGLGNVDNTSDLTKPISTATQTALDLKVDKVTGKSLILDTEITRLSGVSNVDISGKVDKVAGERLISASEITKLSNQSGTNTGDETTASLKTKINEELGFACSDETSVLTTGLKVTFRMPFAMTLSSVRISLGTAPTIGSFIVDVKQNNTSIFSTLISIDASELTSTTASAPSVLSITSLTDDSLMTIHVTQIGSGDPGKGLKLVLIGKKS